MRGRRAIRSARRASTRTPGDWYADCPDGTRLEILKLAIGESRSRRTPRRPRCRISRWRSLESERGLS